MRITRHIRLGIKNLMLHGLRSLLTTLGVVFGVASVVAMLSVGEGASKQAMDQIKRLGSNNILIAAIKPQDESVLTTRRGPTLAVYGLLYEDENRIRSTLPGVAATVPVKSFRKEACFRDQKTDLRIVGTTAEWFQLVQRPLLTGRVLGPSDFADKSNVCVMTEQGVRKLLATEAILGQSIRIGAHYYDVVGVVRSESMQGSDYQTPDKDVDAYVPLNVVRERYGDIDVQISAGNMQREQVELHAIIVQAKTTNDVEPLAAAIKGMLERFHKKVDYKIEVPLTLLRQAEATKRTFNIVLGAIAGISLLVGGIGIMNIMLASVTERTREIGVRRAIGAKRRQIVGQFLIETVVLSTVGGIIGMLIGIAIPYAIEYFAGMKTVIAGYSLILSVGISMGIGIIFGLYPAYRAANLDPIVALRHE